MAGLLDKYRDPRVKDRGGLLPLGRLEDGGMTLAVPQGLLDFVNAIAYPGDVATGRRPVTEGGVTDMAANVVGGAGTAGLLSKGPGAGAIGMNVFNKRPRGPHLTKEMADTILSSNSKKRKRWSPDGEKKAAYEDIRDLRAERYASRAGGDPLEIASFTRPRRLEHMKNEMVAKATIDPLWNKRFADDVHRDILFDGDAQRSINRANMEAVPRLLKKEGWSVRHGSVGKSGRKSSRYMVSPDGTFEVRLSDHYLPETAQRQFNQAAYGTRWNDEIVLQGDESTSDVMDQVLGLYAEWIRDDGA
jgi:hypothetical protein